jgi:hypothetical protein
MEKADENVDFPSITADLRELANRVQQLHATNDLQDRADYRVRQVATGLMDSAGELTAACFMNADWS